MRETYCEADMKFIDTTALADAEAQTGDNQSVADVERLNQGIDIAGTVTGELNQFVLDGSKRFLPDYGKLVFVSKAKSGNDCIFVNNPKLLILFEDPHTSAGLTLDFGETYPAEVKITWYAIDGSKIIDRVYQPSSRMYTCNQQVSDYGRIQVEFTETRLPGEYAHLQYIDYGVHLHWGVDEIISAKVIEEVNPTSSTLSINVANITILDKDNDFDVQNEYGLWKAVQKEQEVALTEYVDGQPVPVGVFFIDEQSYSKNKASFTLIDRIGLMDAHKYYNGSMYNNVKAGTLLEDIFASANITHYLIDDEIYDIPLTGTLGIQSCREALQMICFVCDCVADDSRTGIIRVYRPSKAIKSVVGIDRKFSGRTAISLGEYVSGVSIIYNKYEKSDKVTEIYKDVLPEGQTRIEFTEPYDPTTITVSGGTLVEAKTNYVVVNMASDGQCSIAGIKYEVNKFVYTKNNRLSAGESENVLSFGDCTLYNAEMIVQKASSLLEYHSLRKNVNMAYIVGEEQAGDWVRITDPRQQSSTSMILSQELELAGGFTCTAKCRGYSIVVEASAFAGNELYMPEQELI